MARLGWRPSANVTATTTVRHALILVEHDGLPGAIMDHALADGDSTELCAQLTARGIPYVSYGGFDPAPASSSDLRMSMPMSSSSSTTRIERPRSAGTSMWWHLCAAKRKCQGRSL
jgi:hypothetical protein